MRHFLCLSRKYDFRHLYIMYYTTKIISFQYISAKSGGRAAAKCVATFFYRKVQHLG